MVFDNLSDGGEDFDDDDIMLDLNDGAGESVKKAISRHNNAILHAVRRYGEFLITIMLDHTDLWADGDGEGQRKILEANGNIIVYINDFVVIEYKIGLDEFSFIRKS